MKIRNPNRSLKLNSVLGNVATTLIGKPWSLLSYRTVLSLALACRVAKIHCLTNLIFRKRTPRKVTCVARARSHVWLPLSRRRRPKFTSPFRAIVGHRLLLHSVPLIPLTMMQRSPLMTVDFRGSWATRCCRLILPRSRPEPVTPTTKAKSGKLLARLMNPAGSSRDRRARRDPSRRTAFSLRALMEPPYRLKFGGP